jgi:17beta-estradiol 17-dehydrogenase / very-long-chain 3-oxoacyl-CoA reductase
MLLISQIVYAAGILALTYASYQLFIFLCTFALPSRLHIYHHGSEPWACVTGASDGIGRGIAEELASHNFNLILHGRNAAKLESVKASILQANPSIKIKLFIFDTNQYKTMEESSLPGIIRDLNITMLVNNVGLGYETLTPADVDAQINTNLRFATQLTYFLLPSLKSHSPSLVLTMGSTTAMGMPWVCVYAGAKAYLRAWSRSMGMQIRAERAGVEFLVLDIVEVSTAANAMEVSYVRPTPRAWASAALRRVGRGRRYAHGFWPHAVQRATVDWMSEDVQDWVLLPAMLRRRGGLGKIK